LKEEIENALAPLRGLKVWGPARAVNMLSLQFGESRARISPISGPREVGEYALHVQCPWRVTKGARLVVGSGDLLTPADPKVDRETWDWDVVGATWWDEQIREFFEKNSISLEVEAVIVDAFGGFRLICSGDVTFEVFPTASAAPHDVSEYWRLFRPGGSIKHFVVGTTRVEA
jgi:hypothetical protein